METPGMPPNDPDYWSRRHAAELRETIEREAHASWLTGRRRGWRHPGGSGVVIGTIIVGAGVLLLLDNLGIFHIHNLWRFWPVFLIAAGLSRILEARSTGSYLWGGALCAIGGLFLLDNLGIYNFNFWNLIWPLLLIGFGASMLFNVAERRQLLSRTAAASANPSINLSAVFGGGKRRIESQDFKGGDLVAIFGGWDVDLRHAAIAQTEPAVIDCHAMFGGIELLIPETWLVEVKGMGVFGAFDDKTTPPRVDATRPPQRLIVAGYSIFGGVTIRN